MACTECVQPAPVSHARACDTVGTALCIALHCIACGAQPQCCLPIVRCVRCCIRCTPTLHGCTATLQSTRAARHALHVCTALAQIPHSRAGRRCCPAPRSDRCPNASRCARASATPRIPSAGRQPRRTRRAGGSCWPLRIKRPIGHKTGTIPAGGLALPPWEKWAAMSGSRPRHACMRPRHACMRLSNRKYWNTQGKYSLSRWGRSRLMSACLRTIFHALYPKRTDSTYGSIYPD